jgi:hypothetical protein
MPSFSIVSREMRIRYLPACAGVSAGSGASIDTSPMLDDPLAGTGAVDDRPRLDPE